jgi:hypothetical protein
LEHVKAGETKENFSKAKREMIRRQEQVKQVQSLIKHGSKSDTWVVPLEIEEDVDDPADELDKQVSNKFFPPKIKTHH